MAWFLFVDESGQDHQASPYEVLAGVAAKDETLWTLIRALHDVEVANFGRRYSDGPRELKGKKILKKKTFQLASLNCEVLPQDAPGLAKEALDDGAHNNTVRHLKGLALAKLDYVSEVFSLCRSHGCHVFASVVETDAPRSSLDGLRKDYAYLFERFFYFLEDESDSSGHLQQGIIVFDELEKSRSHLLVDQAHRYFKDTATGRARARLVVPEPFFVHSDLTTGVQIADLVAYIISWGFRTPQMKKPAREELASYRKQIADLRYRTTRSKQGNAQFEIWSVAHISDLRTSMERHDHE
jgi:hypothetical protein